MSRTYHPRGRTVDGYRVMEHPLYCTWACMLSRCNNPNTPGYANYGGRGISVCSRWYHFRFFAADMGQKPAPELTLERTDNDNGYEPGNCKWGTRTEQAWNRRVFVSNTSGHRGVVAIKGRFEARFDYEKARHTIGRFATAEDAAGARASFIEWFFEDRAAALAHLAELERVWCTSTTGVRGVTPHPDGGFMARCTVARERKYLGLFPTVALAAAAIRTEKGLPASCVNAGLTMDPGTVMFWLQQGEEARNAICFSTATLERALTEFAEWIHARCPRNEVRVWMRGPSFDGALLTAAYKAAGIELPWLYWQERCHRTLTARNPSVDAPEREGVFHNARDDSIHQARWLLKIAAHHRSKA